MVPVRDRYPVPASIDNTSDGCRQYCFVCSATTWSRLTLLYVPGLGLWSGAPVSHMSEQTCGSAFGPFGCSMPPAKLRFLRNGASGSVDLPNSKSPLTPFDGNQLHSLMPCSALGRDIPFAV